MRDIARFEHLDDDGLYLPPPVGVWAQKKHRILYHFSSMFATSMGKNKVWDEIVYIDLFSGAGRAKIKDLANIVETSPMLALGLPNQFDRYIFCELASENLSALKARVKEKHPDNNVRYVAGDVNLKTDEILSHLPKYSKDYKVLTFCFADPFNLGNLHFSTIRRLSDYRMDFLVLLPVMDPTRRKHLLTKPEDKVVARFTGNEYWRHAWKEEESNNTSFDIFIAKLFSESMGKMGHKYGGLDHSTLTRATEKNIAIYRLGFFSKHELGEKFWKEALKASIDQRSLFD